MEMVSSNCKHKQCLRREQSKYYSWKQRNWNKGNKNVVTEIRYRADTEPCQQEEINLVTTEAIENSNLLIDFKRWCKHSI